MRTIKHTSRFKRDYKREKQSPKHRKHLDNWLLSAVRNLANDIQPDKRYCDHALVGDWYNHRDLHLRPDLILIYRKAGMTELTLVRLGSHSELGL